jgi:hypothetical protein
MFLHVVKHFRKNKPYWKALDNAAELDFIQSEDDIEKLHLRKELYEKLRSEVMDISKMGWDITLCKAL